jgi:regulator of sirC expression with transglutaminase-like and TPR domain
LAENQIAALMALLEDENRDVASAARVRLVELGEAALPALESAAGGDDAKLRRDARAVRGAILVERAERAFTERLKRGDLDLEACAIDLARTDRPELEPAVVRAKLDDLADRVRAAVAAAPDQAGRAAALGAVLHGEERYRGNAEDYYHPHNSYLDWLLDLRKGIPISLSLLYVFVGRRAGLDVFGVGFPRHFVAAYREGSFVSYLDAFHGGRTLNREQAVAMLTSQNLPSHDALFVEAAPYDVVRRMLANLAYAYRDRADDARSARVSRLLAALEAGRARG